MPHYRYQNFCHETIEDAVLDEFDDGVKSAGTVLYAPTSYTLEGASAVINYESSNNTAMSLVRVYPTCNEVGYPSITGFTMDEAIVLNSSVILLWCVAFGIRASRRTL